MARKYNGAEFPVMVLGLAGCGKAAISVEMLSSQYAEFMASRR
jgi:hypothetical protein